MHSISIILPITESMLDTEDALCYTEAYDIVSKLIIRKDIKNVLSELRRSDA